MKGVIIEMDIYSEIRHRHLNGESQRSIAKNLGIARQTVKKYCAGETHPDARKSYTRESSIMTKEVTDFILSCFAEDDKENLKKQKHSAKRIFDRLILEKNFTGAYSTIRETVRTLKEDKLVLPSSSIPLSYEPGEAVQIDWGEVTTYLDGVKTKLNIFCGRLCYSCDIFVQAFVSANQESFLEAQQNMFDYFEGIPEKVIFDNAKVAVKDGFGLHARPQARYISFSAHYAFSPLFCNPAKGNEKGLVENLVGYSRRNFCVPVPRFKSIELLNKDLLKSCYKYRNKHKVQTRSSTVLEMYQEETEYLREIPTYRFDTTRSKVIKVGNFSTVRFDKNNYSVPARFINRQMTVKGYANHIIIFHNGETIERYPRKYGQNHTDYKLEHYIELLDKKPRSIFQARPVKETMSKTLLDWGIHLKGGNKEMVKLLRLCLDHGEDKILKIRESYPSHIYPSVDMIRSQLHPSSKNEIIYIKNEINITPVNLTRYDEKYGVMNQ